MGILCLPYFFRAFYYRPLFRRVTLAADNCLYDPLLTNTLLIVSIRIRESGTHDKFFNVNKNMEVSWKFILPYQKQSSTMVRRDFWIEGRAVGL